MFELIKFSGILKQFTKSTKGGAAEKVLFSIDYFFSLTPSAKATCCFKSQHSLCHSTACYYDCCQFTLRPSYMVVITTGIKKK